MVIEKIRCILNYFDRVAAKGNNYLCLKVLLKLGLLYTYLKNPRGL